MKSKTSPKIKDEYKEFFAELDKQNPDAVILSESPLSIVDNWVDTGSYALNAIMSGSLFGGVPQGRIVGFTGPSSSGKTLIINKVIAKAQQTLGQFGVIWDSEVAVDKGAAENVGCDTTRIKHCPVETVEDARNQISRFLDNIIAKGMQGKFIIALDSLGNLASAKEIADIEKDKHAVDMGMRAKCCARDTLVQTVNGCKKIEDLEIGNMVLTHMGRYRPIINKWYVPHKKYVTIKAGNKTLKLSEDHRMLIKRNGNLMFEAAKNINKKTDNLIKLNTEQKT